MEEKIKRLLTLTGGASLGLQFLDSMADQLAMTPGVPPGFFEEIKRLADPDEVERLVIPIYMKHYKEETLDQVIAFFESPAGQDWLAAMPAVQKASMEIGQEWGNVLVQRAVVNMMGDFGESH